MKVIKVYIVILLIFMSKGLAGYNAGDDLFYSDKIHKVYISFSQTEYWDSLTYYYDQMKLTNDATYMKATVKINAFTLHDVGMRLKGNSSYGHPGNKKSIKLDFDMFNPGQDFDGLKRLNFHNSFKDPTFLREKVYLDFLRKNGLQAPRCTYGRVYINNEYWGFYTIVEQINKTYLDDNFGNKDGNLFKGDPQGKLSWYGSSQSDYEGKYELKTNEDVNDWSDLVNLIDIINNTTPVDFRVKLDEVMHTTNRLMAWAANNLFVNLDAYLGSGHNYYIYHNTTTDKFDWIIWDANEAFGNFTVGPMSFADRENLNMYFLPSPSNSLPLNMRMLDNNNYKSEYTNILYQYLANSFSEDELYPLIDSLANWIRDEVYADTAKMYSDQNFENNIDSNIILNMGGPGGGQIPGLKPFIKNRRINLEAQMLALGYPPLGTKELTLTNIQIKVYPNPFHATTTFYVSGFAKNFSFELYDLNGKKVISMHNIKGNQFNLIMENYPKGTFLYRAYDKDIVLTTGKIIHL
ncbi:CotH kinase family protein [Candidatus Amoebophilus asiaticus]|nr:CotH kinase family protein [Candidatus Amoebophilus asiaticus]